MSVARVVSLTGVKERVAHLPAVDISSIDHHLVEYDGKFYDQPNAFSISHLRSENKSCVFSYEDKYTFQRILSSDTFIFDSHFESGNLKSAFRYQLQDSDQRAYQDIYELQMSNDVNTDRFTQWFYFSVSNVKVGKVLFLITNFSKPFSLFAKGMRPLMYIVPKDGKPHWTRSGSDISYCSNADTSDENTEAKPGNQGFTLSFSYFFEKAGDKVFFAFCHPYTYTDLQTFLHKIETDPIKRKFVQRTRLCSTIAGNRCDLLTITSNSSSPTELAGRSAIVIMVDGFQCFKNNSKTVLGTCPSW